jgi:hypothetical protein
MSVTKRETAFLLIGLGFGLTLSLMVINEVFKSLIGGARLDSYSFDKMLIVIPSFLLLAGATLLIWKPRSKPRSNALAVDSSHGQHRP